MSYALRAGVSYAFVGEQAVFLDIVADRYFCVGGAVDRVLRKASTGAQLGAVDQEALAPLLDAGLLSPETSRPGRLSPTNIEIRASMIDQPDGRGAWRDMAMAMFDIGAARWALARRPLSMVVSGLLVRRATGGDLTPRMIVARIEAVVAAYRRLGFLLKRPDQCLPRSLAMARSLARGGIRCDLVFGVTLAPFTAHCWIQRDGILLNDTLDHARAYVPVLAL